MNEEPENPQDDQTPVLPANTNTRLDQTVKLDLAIANGSLSLPSHYGRYQVLKRIGIGGFASVYSAFDPDLESLVAIKVLAENHSANLAVRRRFVAEARVARRLGNERLISVFDLGETGDGRPFVVMELAPRGTLRQRVVRTGRPSRDDLIRLIDELGACLTTIHAKGVVHRDIKPSNLLFRAKEDNDFVPGRLIEGDERLVLADFGLARDISGGASALTVGGGTEGYMAPEQGSTDGKPDFRADIYSATVVVAEMTTGRHPERLDLTTADISTEMLEALTRSMATDREQRPATAEEWQHMLGRAYANDALAAADAPGRARSNALTSPLDTTRVGTALVDATDIQSDIPHTSTEPISYVPPAKVENPPPPPGLPTESNLKPPPPDVERPRAIAAAARAQAESEQREAERKAAKRAARRPGPRARRLVGPAGPAQEAYQLAGQPETSARPGVPPQSQPLPQSQQPPIQLLPQAPQQPNPGLTPQARLDNGGAAIPPTTAPPSPPARPPIQPAAGGSRQPPIQAGPKPFAPGNNPAPATSQEGRPPTAPPPATSRPVKPRPAVPLVPDRPTANTGQRSREHMKTARKLARLERRRHQKLARRARRRRRRLRVVNFFLAIIRGLLAGGITLIGGYVVGAALIGPSLDQRPGLQGLILLVSGLMFLWGTSYFPFPRPRDI